MAVLNFISKLLFHSACESRRSSATKLARLVSLGLMVVLTLPLRSAPAPSPASEYEVKAAFLYNFVKFVEWPPKVFPEKETPYIIGILGDDDPFFDPNALVNYLDVAVKDKKINDRKLVIRRAGRISNLKDSHLVFIAKSERNYLKEITAVCQTNNILTVSEMDGFCSQGGVINFFTQAGKVRFEINPTAAEQSNLRVSSKLLNVAKIISPPQ